MMNDHRFHNEEDELTQDKVEFKAQGDAQNFLRNINAEKKGAMLPPPPKPGEIMYCQVCGKAMLPKDFSKNEWMRKREFKWHMHEACMKQMEDLVDRSTPGIMAERKGR